MSKREELREKRRRQQQRQRTILIIGIALVAVIVAAAFIVPGIIQNAKPVGTIVTVTPMDYPNPQKTSLGDPNAPVKVVEYSDYQCPYCKEFNDNLWPNLMKNEIANGKVYFTYVPYQVIGPESDSAANAALCAADQNKFWPFHDILFANQGAENSGQFSDNRLKAMAQAAGLDMNQFNSCYSSKKFKDQIAQDQAQGSQVGVYSTPSFTINGKLLQYNQQPEIIAAIDKAVAGQ